MKRLTPLALICKWDVQYKTILLSLSRKPDFLQWFKNEILGSWYWNTNKMSKQKESLPSFQVNYRYSYSFPNSPVDWTVIHISYSQDKLERTPVSPHDSLRSPVWLAFTSRRGCSRKAASKDIPVGLWEGKPESRTGSGPGCPARWPTGRATNLPGSWQALPAALGRKTQKRGACRLGWGWPGWRLTEP